MAPGPEFRAREGNTTPALIELMGLTRDEFRLRFRKSPVKRATYRGFLRNVAVALGNSGDPAAVGPLEKGLEHEESLVRAHAAWSLGQLGARGALERRRIVEEDGDVRREIEDAMAVSGL